MSIGTAIGLTGVAAGLATAGTISAGVGAAGAIGSSLIQSNSADNAISAQQQEANNSLAFQQQEFNTQQTNEAPWLAEGQTALGQLAAGTAPGGQFTQPYTGTFNPGTFTPPSPFVAPTGLTEQNDPGFQQRLALGQQALEASQAAQGITGGGALQAAEQYGQTFATNDFQNVYGNALNTYNTNYNSALNTYNANYQSGLGAFNTNYNVFANNQANQFNRLSALAGAGQTAAGQLGQAGQAAASNVTGIDTNLGNQTSNLLTQQGNVLGAGLGGAASTVSGAINNYSNYNQLQQLLAQQNASNSSYGPYGTNTGNGGSYNVPGPPSTPDE